MSPGDKVEQILKDIHLLFADSREFVVDPKKILVDKAQAFDLLKKLNLAMYEVMESYDATKQKQDLARRRTEKQAEKILEEYQSRAEDIYAASMVFNGDALSRTHKVVSQATHQIEKMARQMAYDFERERQKLQDSQDDLLEQLQDFKNTNKYLGLLEHLNKERGREEKRHYSESRPKSPGNKPEIKVNPAYFERREKEEAANRRKKYDSV